MTARKFQVELRAFGGNGEIREVEVPEVHVEDLLETIFYFGQNDHQPKPQRSVSVGDVIVVGVRRFRVDGVGFTELS